MMCTAMPILVPQHGNDTWAQLHVCLVQCEQTKAENRRASV